MVSIAAGDSSKRNRDPPGKNKINITQSMDKRGFHFGLSFTYFCSYSSYNSDQVEMGGQGQ